MLPLSSELGKRYEAVLEQRDVPPARYQYYKKWLCYYLDFCAKYPSDGGNADHVRLFLEKLKSKHQTSFQCQQAAHAISLYFELSRLDAGDQYSTGGKEPNPSESVPAEPETVASPTPQRSSQFRIAGYQETSDSPEWDEVLANMVAEIKVRHYSRKTLTTYAKWSRHFQRFLKSKPPQALRRRHSQPTM